MNKLAVHLLKQDLDHQKAKLDWLLSEIALLEKRSHELRQTIQAGEQFLAGTNGDSR